MSQRRPFTSLLLIAFTALTSLAACSSSDPPDLISTYGFALEGEASQAQLDTFVHAKARDWGWAGGAFDAPEDGATLSADTALTFTWHADRADVPEDASDVVITHLLLFSSKRYGSLLKVFTSLPEYTPSAQDWQKLVDAGEPITLSIMTGTFVGTDLPTGGGPFLGQTLTFTIE
ncbi:MAG: hypothetical protein WDO74_06720 [Pseudomonadota bacterium]